MSVLNPVVVAIVAALSVTAAVVPLEGEVVRRFDAPACPWCPGHRGITVRAEPGQEVVAVADGQVVFAGPVGGAVYVVQSIGGGVRVTYGHLGEVAPGIEESAQVVAGQVVALAGGAVHIGVRLGEAYLDPLAFFGWGRGRLVGPPGVLVGSGGPGR